jgi:hypothetical protein
MVRVRGDGVLAVRGDVVPVVARWTMPVCGGHRRWTERQDGHAEEGEEGESGGPV